MKNAKRSLVRALPAAIGLVFLLPVFKARATYYSDNGQNGSDIVMKDYRWPFEDRGTYYAFWLMSFVPGHPRLGSMYGGVHTGGADSAPGMFMSYWGEIRNVHEGEYFYPHGYGAEGASGGAHGEAHFVRPNAWYRMVMRVFQAETEGDTRTLVGWWVKDIENDRWYTHSVVELPAEATGFRTASAGFVEALGSPSEPRAFERRLGYCRLNGQWHKADTVSSAGGKFFRLVEDGTVLRYDRAESDNPSAKETRKFVLRQPDTPDLDGPAIADLSALGLGNQVAVKWSVPRNASPQLGYRLDVFDSADAGGAPMKTFEEAMPSVRAKRLDTPRRPKSVRLTLRDIFDQTTSTVVPVETASPLPAGRAGTLRPGLEYAYYEAPKNITWEQLPEFSALTPVKQGHVLAIDDTVREARQKLYALRYAGYLRVPADGVYVLSVGTCDGSRLRIGGKVIADNDGVHGRGFLQYPVALAKGLYPFEMEYFRGPGRGRHADLAADILRVFWEGPDFGFRRLTQGDFLCDDQGDIPSLEIALKSDIADGVVKDNLVDILLRVDPRTHRLASLQIYSGNKLMETVDGAALDNPEAIRFRKLFPAGENAIRARLWYDDHCSVDGDKVLAFKTRQYNDGPWEFIRLGHEFPLAARCKDGIASFAGEGSCVGYQKVTGDFTLTAHIDDIVLRTPESGVYDQNWLGLYTSNVRRMNPEVGLKSTFDEYGFGIYLTAGRGMKGYSDWDDLGGSRMSEARFESDHRWLRIVRRGKQYQSFTSADGRTWVKAQELISRHIPEDQYAGLWFRTVPGRGRGLFQGSLDQVTLERGKVPEEILPTVRAEDLPTANRITALVQAPKNPAILYARTPGRGMFKSADRGETWKAANQGLIAPMALAVRSVAVHPDNASIVLRAGGCVVGGALQSGLWRSADAGVTWKLVSREIDFDGRGPATLFGEVVAFCPQDPNWVAAAGETAGLFLSRDAGQTWRKEGLDGSRITSLGFHPESKTPLLLIGTSADKELAALGLGNPAAPVHAPGGLYWVRIRDRNIDWQKAFELDDMAVTNVAPGDYEEFATIATSRGIYYTWQHGNVFSKRIHKLPTDQLYTALGYRHFKKSIHKDDWRTRVNTYAAPFAGPDRNPVHWVPERTMPTWRLLSNAVRIEGAPEPLELNEGISCILPDREEPNILFLCNRLGIFKTTDHGKSYRRVYKSPPG